MRFTPHLVRLAAVLLAALSLSTATAQQRCSAWLPRASNGDCGMYEVSMVQLIANPEAFDGKLVAVVGFMNIEFEGSALYMHREDWTVGIPMNSLALVVPHSWAESPTCRNRSYVLLHGLFSKESKGHALWRAGSLESINVCRSRTR